MPVKVCISGKIAAGKTTLAQALSRHFRIHVVSFGKIMKEYLRKCGIEPTRKVLHDKSEEIVSRVGNYGAMDWFVENSSEVDWASDLIIEGCRHPDTFRRMQELFGPCLLIHCSCSQATQIQRVMERDGLSLEKTLEVISSPTEADLDHEFFTVAHAVHNEHTSQTETINALIQLMQKNVA